jgi:hypothetical protein
MKKAVERLVFADFEENTAHNPGVNQHSAQLSNCAVR